MGTAIQWTHRPGTVGEVWNPISGCTRVSPGCEHCYAERMTHREMSPKWVGLTTEKGRWTGEVRLHPELLDVPLHWRRPRTVFVCSMADLFHERVDGWFILRVWQAMVQCPQHTFMVLTKRPARMARWMTYYGAYGAVSMPHIWMGTSVEDQQRADERIPHLLRVPAAVRFLSVEPLLGPVDLSPWLDQTRIQFVIIGGESGHGARPMELEWARDLIDQCRTAGVAPFLKQLGSVQAKRLGLRDHKGGDPEEWPADLRVREFPR